VKSVLKIQLSAPLPHRAVPARGLQVFVTIVATMLTWKFWGACYRGDP